MQTQRRRSVFRIEEAKSGMGGGSDHGAKSVYVYLLTSIILYKKYCLLWGEANDVCSRIIYYWVGNRHPTPRIDAPAQTYLYVMVITNKRQGHLFHNMEGSSCVDLLVTYRLIYFWSSIIRGQKQYMVWTGRSTLSHN